jgi:hypothetical protein
MPAPAATCSRLPGCSRSSPCSRRPAGRESVTASWHPPPLPLGWFAPARYALLLAANRGAPQVGGQPDLWMICSSPPSLPLVSSGMMIPVCPVPML